MYIYYIVPNKTHVLQLHNTFEKCLYFYKTMNDKLIFFISI